MLQPVSVATDTEQKLVEVKLLAAGLADDDCKRGKSVLTTVDELQEMNNDLAQKVERALRTVPRLVKK